MIDCSKPINYPQVIRTNITYANYKQVKEDVIVNRPRQIIEASPRFGYVETDEKETDQFHKLQSVCRMYDVIDLETGYVLARVFKRQIKEAAKMLAEFKHIGDGKYKSVTWDAEITSKRRYTQDDPQKEVLDNKEKV